MRHFSFNLIAALTLFAGSSLTASAELLFFDDFNYVANPDTIVSSSDNPFVHAGGWNGLKSVETDPSFSDNGSLTTVTKAQFDANTGTSMPWPGGDSSYTLRMAGNNRAGGTDFYLALGDGNQEDFIPANVYFQFWIYMNRHGDEITAVETRHKMLYPTNTGYGSDSNKWLFSFSAHPYITTCPGGAGCSYPGGNPTDGRAYFVDRDGTDRFSAGHVKRFTEYGSDIWGKLGANLGPESERYIQSNRWTLVRIHYDTSNNASGVFEVWFRHYGEPWQKVAEWIGGQSPNANFEWYGFGAGGHRRLRMPTTVGITDRNDGIYYYLRDFAMANSPDSLPVYEDEVAAPLPPTDVGVE